MAAKNIERYDAAVIGVGVGANYGSVLTYYSLYKTIEGFGNDVLMVSKIGARDDDPEIQDTHAMRFAHEHYNLSKVYSRESVSELNDIADTFVVGSDQVWNYGISKGFGKAFYLDFAEEGKRKISYASSFGHVKDFAPSDEVPKISALMKRFNAASVREDTGVALARSVYGVPVRQVAEPIFLTAVEHYEELGERSSRDVSDPYLLAYILDPTPEKKAAIEHVAGKLGLKVRVMLDAWPHLFDENKAKMDLDDAIEEDINTYDFLKLYSRASYVITDSFHGTAFALKFEKPFASIGNRRRGVTRFESIFRLVGHGERFTLRAEDIIERDDDFLAPLDFSGITAALNKHVKDSKKWLKDSLKKSPRDTIARRENKKTRKAARVARSGVRKLGRGVRRVARLGRARKPDVNAKAPMFHTNNESWKIERSKGSTRLRVAAPGYAGQRGNYAWTQLPAALDPKRVYELVIDWTPYTSARVVKVHVRNSETGKFQVIGSVEVLGVSGEPRQDRMVFTVNAQGYTQVMLGALHFGGVDGGADVNRITLRQVSDNARPSARSTSPAESAAVAAVRDLGDTDDQRYIAAYAHHRVSRTTKNARALLMYHAHGFEKGLSRTDDFRPGFGQASMPLLAVEMNKWIAGGGSSDDSFFGIAASVMRAYFDRHRKLDVDVSHFWELFDPAVQRLIAEADTRLGGAIPANLVREAAVEGVAARSFIDVVFSRRSVRKFTTDAVEDEDIERAVAIALQAPSVCNRQPARVHQFEDEEAMRAVLDLQGGFRGYAPPPKLLLITSDHAAYVAAVERNQAYIDGGLFMMLLLLALEEVGLGSVSLNTAMGKEKEEAIRRILGIPDSEVFISFVAVGQFESDVTVPRSKRIDVNEVLVRHGDHEPGLEQESGRRSTV